MTTNDLTQLKETLAKIQQAIQNRTRDLEGLRDFSSPEEIAEYEADLARLRQKEAGLVAKLEGAGAIAQQGGIAAAALGDRSLAAGQIGRDLIANNKFEWLFVQIVNQAATPDPTDQRFRELKRRYLENLARDCDVLRLSDLGGKQEIDQQVRLSQVYIGLNTTSRVPVTEADKGRQAPFRFENERLLSALEAAAGSDYLALVGDPGSGKSTFVRQLTAWLALAHLGDEEGLKHLAGWAEGYWPFLLNLRDLAPALSEINPQRLSAEGAGQKLVAAVEAGWQAQLERLAGVDLARRLPDLLAQEQLLLVFDGLDEVAEPLRPRLRQVMAALRQAPHLRVGRIIVTSRTRSYTEQSALPGFSRQTLQTFDEKQVNDFIAAWYQVQGRLNRWEEARISHQTGDLQQAVHADSHLFELAQNPLLLTVMAIIHQQQVRLPPQRVQLYSRAV
ncbi:MAG TPA: AAA family ATPase, partial [Anaerolineae bacterium]